MIEMVKRLVASFWLRVRHPSINYHGSLSAYLSTDIRIKGNGRITFGRGITLEKRVSISAIGGEVFIGDLTAVNRNCIIVAHELIKIGNNVAIGPNVCIYDHDHAWDNNGIIKGKYKNAPIEIGDNCWIGANAIILAGAVIGKGTIVGAGTIVKGKVPDYSLIYDYRDKRTECL